jgi:hypothetical protein
MKVFGRKYCIKVRMVKELVRNQVVCRVFSYLLVTFPLLNSRGILKKVELAQVKHGEIITFVLLCHKYCAHKVHTRIYLEYYSVCPPVGIGTLPPPLPPASECALVLPPGPGTKGLGLGGGTLLRVR